MIERIQVRDYDAGDDHLPADLHPVLRRILLARGIRRPEQMDLGMQNLLGPGGLGDMETAARLVAAAIQDRQSILIVGDFDADGATGSALAVLALRAMGGQRVDFRVPNRFEDGYGLTVTMVKSLSSDPPDLLITVDSGISSIDGVRAANELGCRVIVTDHHLPGESLPSAAAIVNPNCAGSVFVSKSLAGVGVMFYLLSVVRKTLREQQWFEGGRVEPNLASFLDLVALGTVADLVPLDFNNRILVHQGLERIRRGLARPGLLALLKLGKRDYRHLVAADLGFAVGPRLNAAGRLEDMSVGIRCLLSDDRNEAAELAATLDALNQKRKTMQASMQGDAIKQVNELITGLKAQELPSALCLYQKHWHQGIVGLVASRIKDVVHRPVVAFAPAETDQDPNGVLKGSARSVRGLNIRDALALVDARHPGLILSFGGHAMAAGLALESARYSDLEMALPEAVDELLDGATLSPEVLTDGELDPPDMNLTMAQDIEALGPWGQRFPEPLFEGAFVVIDHRIVGNHHLKLIVRAVAGGDEIDAIAFNHLPEDLGSESTIRCLYRLDINRWRGREDCQLRLEKILQPPSSRA